jgi:hypothetical protein
MRNSLAMASVLLLLAFGAQQSRAENGWKNLFDGKNLDGWVQRGGEAKYTVENGVLVGSTVLNTGNSFLCTKEDYGDFILELEFKVDPALNSGVQVRSECFDEKKSLEANGKTINIPAKRVHGYQVEIDMDATRARWWVGGIYDEGRRDWLFPGSLGGDAKAFTAQGAKLAKQNEWNKFRVEAKGASIKTFLNGEPRAEITDSLTPKGFIALQVHGIGKDKAKENLKVEFRNIKIKPL